MNENGLVATEPRNTESGWGSGTWVPRLVYPSYPVRSNRTHSRSYTVLNLHGAPTREFVRNDQPHRPARRKRLVHRAINVFLACGSLYVIGFAILLVL